MITYENKVQVYFVTHTLTSEAETKWRHFAQGNFKCILLTGNIWVSTKIPLKFIPTSPIDNKSTLVRIKAWCRTDDPVHWLRNLAGNSLQRRQNERDGVSNHQPHDCLRFQAHIKENIKAPRHCPVTVLSLSLSPVNSPHKAPVTQKMFPYDDVIMWPSKLPMSVHRQQFLYGVWLRAADRSYGTVHGVQLNCLPNFMYTNRHPQKKPLYRLGANLAMEFSS